MTKLLFDALSTIKYTVVSSDGKTEINPSESQNPEISSLVFDSRDVKPGSLFFALPGTHTTGNVFIPKAIENGASAIVFEGDLGESLPPASHFVAPTPPSPRGRAPKTPFSKSRLST